MDQWTICFNGWSLSFLEIIGWYFDLWFINMLRILGGRMWILGLERDGGKVIFLFYLVNFDFRGGGDINANILISFAYFL